MALKKFELPIKVVCPKCLFMGGMLVKYRKEASTTLMRQCDLSLLRDWLEMTCPQCGFSQNMECADQKENDNV